MSYPKKKGKRSKVQQPQTRPFVSSLSSTTPLSSLSFSSLFFYPFAVDDLITHELTFSRCFYGSKNRSIYFLYCFLSFSLRLWYMKDFVDKLKSLSNPSLSWRKRPFIFPLCVFIHSPSLPYLVQLPFFHLLFLQINFFISFHSPFFFS